MGGLRFDLSRLYTRNWTGFEGVHGSLFAALISCFLEGSGGVRENGCVSIHFLRQRASIGFEASMNVRVFMFSAM